ncbi:MAG TPA: carbon storage regulator [Caulifigura sp.]|jgi:carbon storage regulator|nr:carbon storage regulator [Caulifigura sp.]
MLVLARKVEQSILLDGGKIRISVLEVQGGRVKLGIEAPKEIAIQREQSPAVSRFACEPLANQTAPSR